MKELFTVWENPSILWKLQEKIPRINCKGDIKKDIICILNHNSYSFLKNRNTWVHTISLIPLSLPEVSFGLEAGLGGGTMVPTERGVVGLAGGGKRKFEENYY